MQDIVNLKIAVSAKQSVNHVLNLAKENNYLVAFMKVVDVHLGVDSVEVLIYNQLKKLANLFGLTAVVKNFKVFREKNLLGKRNTEQQKESHFDEDEVFNNSILN